MRRVEASRLVDYPSAESGLDARLLDFDPAGGPRQPRQWRDCVAVMSPTTLGDFPLGGPRTAE
eukprot:2453577-Lingulodinium_polyedra.AAC.1